MGSVTPNQASFVLPQVVDEIAFKSPQKTWMTIPFTTGTTRGWKNVTFSELAQAVDGMAWWVEQEVPEAMHRDVIAFMGINDIRYIIVMIALIKAGFKAMVPSLRNSAEGQKSLLEATKCKVLLHSEAVDKHVDAIKEAVSKLKTIQIPSLEDCLRAGADAPVYPANNSLAEDAQILVIHTSGSTGLPKPVYETNGGLATIGNISSQKLPSGRRTQAQLWTEPKPIFSMLPFFHMMGLMVMTRSIFCQAPAILLPADKPINTKLIVEVLNETNPWGGFFAPSMLEELSEIPEGVDALSKLEYLFYGGAPLSRTTGQRLQEHSGVINLIGSSEALVILTLMHEHADEWPYFEWAPGAGVVMEPDTEGLYELVLTKQGDPRYQALAYNFPDSEAWHTKDLFREHSPGSGLWEYVGRKDDVLVLSNGEKLNPVGFEKMVESHPLIKGALVVGQGRFQTGLLVEPNWTKLPDSQDALDLIDQIWPIVEKANAVAVTHGRVWKSKIAVSKKDKPFNRAPKGSIMRRATIQSYEEEIEALYSNESFDEQLGNLAPESDLPTIKEFLIKAIALSIPDFPKNVEGDLDIFAFGMDSLKVLALASALNHALGGGNETIVSPRDVYSNHTINELAGLLYKKTHDINDDAEAANREDIMANMIEKFTKDLPTVASTQPWSHVGMHTVMLTGSTGSLGNYILQDLITSPHVSKVYCLNRSEDAEPRQRQGLEERGFTPDFSKVTFLKAEFGAVNFALPENVYEELLSTVDTIIHNAWAVNFNMSLTSYEDVHVTGVRRCIDFSLKSTNQAHILFISSVASVGNWKQNHASEPEVPESLFQDNSTPLPQGYGESKHVAEMILGEAASRCRVPVTVVRSGQLAGPTSGDAMWGKQEWFPSLVATSKAMGLVPETLGNQDVDWVAIDIAAKVVCELAESRAITLSKHDKMLDVFHLTNPHVSAWQDLVPALQKEFGSARLVSYRSWVDELRNVPLTAQEAEKKPGVKLVDFYEGLTSKEHAMPGMSTSNTVLNSKSLAALKAVDVDLMNVWMQQWKF